MRLSAQGREMTLTEERLLIESHCPGWHLWWTDMHRLRATRDDGYGGGVTIPIPGLAVAENRIAEYEHMHPAGIREVAPMTTSGGFVRHAF